MYFPKEPDPLTWLHNLFIDSQAVIEQNLSIKEKEQLNDISTELTLKTVLQGTFLDKALISIYRYYETSLEIFYALRNKLNV